MDRMCLGQCSLELHDLRPQLHGLFAEFGLHGAPLSGVLVPYMHCGYKSVFPSVSLLDPSRPVSFSSCTGCDSLLGSVRGGAALLSFVFVL
jgi:hypothetical protein